MENPPMRVISFLFYSLASLFLGVIATVAISPWAETNGYSGLAGFTELMTYVGPIAFLVFAVQAMITGGGD